MVERHVITRDACGQVSWVSPRVWLPRHRTSQRAQAPTSWQTDRQRLGLLRTNDPYSCSTSRLRFGTSSVQLASLTLEGNVSRPSRPYTSLWRTTEPRFDIPAKAYDLYGRSKMAACLLIGWHSLATSRFLNDGQLKTHRRAGLQTCLLISFGMTILL